MLDDGQIGSMGKGKCRRNRYGVDGVYFCVKTKPACEMESGRGGWEMCIGGRGWG